MQQNWLLLYVYQPNCYIIQFSFNFALSALNLILSKSSFVVPSLVAEFNSKNLCSSEYASLSLQPTILHVHSNTCAKHHFYQNIIRIYDWFEHFHLTSFLCLACSEGREDSHTIYLQSFTKVLSFSAVTSRVWKIKVWNWRLRSANMAVFRLAGKDLPSVWD